MHSLIFSSVPFKRHHDGVTLSLLILHGSLICHLSEPHKVQAQPHHVLTHFQKQNMHNKTAAYNPVRLKLDELEEQV